VGCVHFLESREELHEGEDPQEDPSHESHGVDFADGGSTNACSRAEATDDEAHTHDGPADQRRVDKGRIDIDDAGVEDAVVAQQENPRHGRDAGREKDPQHRKVIAVEKADQFFGGGKSSLFEDKSKGDADGQGDDQPELLTDDIRY